MTKERNNLQDETVDELRYRLDAMKRMMAQREQNAAEEPATVKKNVASIIDGNFLSMVFGVALIVILSVSVYAFYNLYHAILKKFPSHHTEL